jgi:hypothetical protein
MDDKLKKEKMEIPNELKGELEGAFFRRKDKTYTFMSYGNRSLEEGKRLCEESFGCTFIKHVKGVNVYFFHAANLFASDKLDKMGNVRAEDIILEEIVRYVGKNGNG